MKKNILRLIILISMLFPQFAHAAGLEYMDMNNWIQTGPGLASWEVAAGGRTVSQGLNGEPSFFISTSDYQNVVFKSTLEVTVPGDDDMIGVVASFHSPLDTSSAFFKTILFDWKQSWQDYKGYICNEGMALSDVEGTINIVPSTEGTLGFYNLHTYFWSKQDPNPYDDIKWDVLDTRWGSDTGWVDYTKYQFEMLVTDTQIRIKIDGQLIFDQTGNFEPGRIGFYNFSQDGVVYGNVQIAPGSRVPSPPISQDDRYGTSPDAVLTVDRFEGVLKNDYDPNLDDVQIELVKSVLHGSLDLDSNTGKFTYIPDPLYQGKDSFVYQVVDKDGVSNVNTVTLGVIANNQAPSDIQLSNATIGSGAATGTVVGTLTTSDPNNPIDEHDYILLNNGNGDGLFKVVSGQVQVADSQALAPGEYTIEVRSTDLMNTTYDKTFTILVVDNTSPTGGNDTIFTTEDTTYTFGSADFTFADNDADAFGGIRIETVETAGNLEYQGVDVFPGTVISDITRLTFKPDLNVAGDAYATFDYKVIDARGAISADTYRMVITVTAVDDEPVLANPIFDVTVNEDAFDTVINLADVFADVDSVITKSVLSNSNPGLVAASVVDDVLRLFYEADQNGTATITVRGSADGKMVEDSFEVTVNAVNDPPVLTDYTLSVDENSASGTSVGTALATEVDADQVISYIITDGNTSDVFAIDSSTGEITINLAGLDFEATSSYTLTVEAADNGEPPLTSSATVTVNINDVNDPPTGINATVSIAEDTIYTFALSDFGFADQDGDELSAVKVVSVEGAGSVQLNGADVAIGESISRTDLTADALRFVPTPNESGVEYASFEFKVNDGNIDSMASYTLTIDVVGEDDGPFVAEPIGDVTVEEDAANTIIDLSSVFDDIDTDPADIAVSIASNSNESLVVAAISDNMLSLAYQPDQNGVATIVIQGTAEGKTVDDSFGVTVNAVNDPPVLASIGDKTVLEGEELTFPIVVSDLETLEEQLHLSATGLPAKASVVDNHFRWAPAYGEAGDYQLTFTVSDGELTDSETITISIMPVDRPIIAFTLQDSYDNAPLNPGDIITYHMELTNSGQADLVDAVVHGSIPSNTSYVSGSTRLNGQSVADIAGESPLVTGLTIASPEEAPGVLRAGAGSPVSVEYCVQILGDLAPGALITNQAKLSGSGDGSGPIQPLVSDDPDTEPEYDATVSSVGNRPVIDAQMTVTDDNGGRVEPSDVLTYTVLISNHGVQAATEVEFTNTLPVGTTFVVDSLTVLKNGSSQQANYSVTDQGEILVDLGDIHGQELIQIRYKASVNADLDVETTQLSSQGFVASATLPNELTDQDGDDSNGDQPTEIAVGLNPVILTRIEAKDFNGGAVLPGDRLEFSIIVENTGSAPAAGLVISANVPVGLSYLAGTTRINGMQTTDIIDQQVNYGVIVPGERVVASYLVEVPGDTPLGTVLVSTAEISGLSVLECSIQVGGSPGSAGISGIIEDSLDAHESPEGWIVDLYQNGVFMGNRVLGQTGEYSFTGLQPNTDYQVSLRHPETNVVYSNQNIEDLQPGLVGEAILPMDPSGVIYDAVARTPVEGAVASIYGPDGNLVPAEGLLPGQQNQRTGADGRYRFDLRIGLEAPEGTYKIVVTPPAEYSQHFPSTLIEPTIDPVEGAFDPPASEDVCPISASEDPPQLGDDTTYYLSFDLAVGDPDIINNHIPVDPDLGTALTLTLTADKTVAAIGDFVTYTLTVENLLPLAVEGFAVNNIIPAGFKYVAGVATANGERALTWSGLTLAGGESLELKYTLLVGTGVIDGLIYTNRALAVQTETGQTVSNTAEVGVRISAVPIFTEPVIIGKVFVDRDGDGLQHDGEEGLANIGLYTLSGQYIMTDSQGRFHIKVDAVPQARGENFLIKLDTSTLPQGVKLLSDNPQGVRLTPGMMQKMNFAIALE